MAKAARAPREEGESPSDSDASTSLNSAHRPRSWFLQALPVCTSRSGSSGSESSMQGVGRNEDRFSSVLLAAGGGVWILLRSVAVSVMFINGRQQWGHGDGRNPEHNDVPKVPIE